MNKMLAAVLHDFNDLKLEQVDIPRVENDGEVIVKIKSCGIVRPTIKLSREFEKT